MSKREIIIATISFLIGVFILGPLLANAQTAQTKSDVPLVTYYTISVDGCDVTKFLDKKDGQKYMLVVKRTIGHADAVAITQVNY